MNRTVSASAIALAFAGTFASQAKATELSDAAAALQPGEWVELSTQGLLAAVSEPSGGATGSVLVFAESAVWDPSSAQVIFIGSDHIYDGQSSGPRMMLYGDQTNSWITQQVSWAGSGTMHGYDHTAVMNGQLYQMTLVRGQPLYRFDPLSDDWTALSGLEDGEYNRFGGLALAPGGSGLVYVTAYEVYHYDLAGDQWTTIASGVPMGDYHNFAEYNPVHDVVLLGGGNSSGALHVLDDALELDERTSAPFALRVNEAIVTHDPNSGDYLLFGGDQQFLTYDPASDEFLTQDSSVPFFDNYSDEGMLTVAAAIDSYGVVMFVEHNGIGLDGSAHVWLYRHAPGMGSPPDPSGTDSDSSSSGGDDGAGTGGPSDSGTSSTAGTGTSTNAGSGDTADSSGVPGDTESGTGSQDSEATSSAGCQVARPSSLPWLLGLLFVGIRRLRRRRSTD